MIIIVFDDDHDAVDESTEKFSLGITPSVASLSILTRAFLLCCTFMDRHDLSGTRPVCTVNRPQLIGQSPGVVLWAPPRPTKPN